MIDSILFWGLATVSVLAALGVVFHRSIIYSALLLIGVFLSIAGVFLLNNADFLAIAQTIVYAVGLTIILIFGVMLTGDRPIRDHQVSKARYYAYAVVSLFTLGLLVRGVIFPYVVRPMSPELVQTLQTQGSTAMLGQLLFSRYALPFELASILLLVAMIGAILISKKKFTTAAETLGKTKYALNTTSAPSLEAQEDQRQAALLGQPPEDETPAVEASSQDSPENLAGVQ